MKKLYQYYNALATSLCFVCMWVVSEALITWQRYGMSYCHIEPRSIKQEKKFNNQIEHNCDSAPHVSG